MDRESALSLWSQLAAAGVDTERSRPELADERTLASAEAYGANIESMIGTVKLPVGVIGPLLVNGLHAKGAYHVPLATTEAALVASYGRGARLVTMAGGGSAALLHEGVLRSPGFRFAGIAEAGRFVEWVARAAEDLKAAAEATTRHGRLVSLEPVIDNDIVLLLCRYTTGDAAGQNTVTIAAEALCRRTEETCPVEPLHWFIEANFSGDTKASYLGLLTGRGRRPCGGSLPGEAEKLGRARFEAAPLLHAFSPPRLRGPSADAAEPPRKAERDDAVPGPGRIISHL